MSELLKVSFQSEVIHWRGPSPFFFLKVPVKVSLAIKTISKQVSYGWGVIPCDVTIDSVQFYTALFPKEESYLVPLKKVVREDLNIELGDRVKATIRISSGI